MKQISLFISGAFSGLFLLFSVVGVGLPAGAAQDSTQLEQVCTGSAANSPICQEANRSKMDETTGIDNTIRIATNLIAFVGGFIAVVIMVISGITLITSGGDSGKITNARNSIIYSAAGIVAIIFARVIVLFVINEVG